MPAGLLARPEPDRALLVQAQGPARLRARAARTLDALEAELGPAPATITSQDAHGWFRLCGYDDTPN